VKGFVDIVWIVGIDGKPTAIEVTDSSHMAFVDPAFDALKKWKFRPVRKDCMTMALKVRQKIMFNQK
jgi:outer membrane biosynthesis protein TonB